MLRSNPEIDKYLLRDCYIGFERKVYRFQKKGILVSEKRYIGFRKIDKYLSKKR